MGQRTTYFCDLCGVTSPLETSTPSDWRVATSEFGVREHVCAGCVEALNKATAAVRVERAKLKAAR